MSKALFEKLIEICLTKFHFSKQYALKNRFIKDTKMEVCLFEKLNGFLVTMDIEFFFFLDHAFAINLFKKIDFQKILSPRLNFY